ncbi:hypothetical protein ABFB09_01285 [Dehalogenimonas sp. THU2]|uniref:hypothetical protein n=1 Tax=Dehalogenimonas sp. THU2 TaxID=3151121 RepID=UPI0032181D78
MDLNKRFSIAHFDSWPGADTYYDVIQNSTPGFRHEIYDIYFGKMFRYRYHENEVYDSHQRLHEVNYGNVMGVEATDAQVDNLFRIQREFGIDISLTINQLNIPIELFYSKNDKVVRAFIEWLGAFYQRGLRSCTLANNHMMRIGVLQRQFPEMKWKNTVNQQVATAQQVLDYLHLGYNVVQLDRSLNRNLIELRRIKDAVENFKTRHPDKYVKTCMLVMEDCLPFCPFKREHDDLQIYHKKVNYWLSAPGESTCDRWRNSATGKSLTPRSGTNCVWVSPSTFKEYAELVDIFKFSGRLTAFTRLEGEGSLQYGWSAKDNAVSCFSEILENNLAPVSGWALGAFKMAPFEHDPDKIREDLRDSIWLTENGLKLEQTLKNCRNQCYACHMCERTFGSPQVDSMIEL